MASKYQYCLMWPKSRSQLHLAVAIYADLQLPNVTVCSIEHHLGVRIPDAANLVRMDSVAWDLLRMMHCTAEENRAPRVHANPMFQYFFFWLAWTLVLLSIPCFNACVRRSKFKMPVFRTNIKNMKTISRYTSLPNKKKKNWWDPEIEFAGMPQRRFPQRRTQRPPQPSSSLPQGLAFLPHFLRRTCCKRDGALPPPGWS